MVMKMVMATNATAAFSENVPWTDLDVFEFDDFIACIILFGIARFSSRSVAFDKIWGYKQIQDTMDEARFEQILRNWKWEDTTGLSEAEKLKRRNDDPFWQVTGLVDDLNKSCQQDYCMHQSADCDEQTIPWKGRHRCKCYNPSKPEKWHFKCFALNDAATGYQYAFYLYRGKDEDRPADVSATEYPVLRVTDNAELHNKNFVVYCDNWFSSVHLFEKMLLERGIHCVGTTRTNKKNWPKNFSLSNSAQRGKFVAKQATIPSTVNTDDERRIYAYCWMDNKPVNLLSTFPSNFHIKTRNSKDKKTRKYQKVNLEQPTIYNLYNFGMGGTDHVDQMLSYYRPKIKTRKWPTRIIIHFILVSIFNAFVLYKDSQQPKRGENGFTYISFLQMLVTDLRATRSAKKSAQVLPDRKKSFSKMAAMETSPSRVSGQHFPYVDTDVSEKEQAAGLKKRRGNCMYCRKKTNVMCGRCEKFLCVVNSDADGDPEDTCWKSFHTKADFKK
jgi:hypothetical protein